MSLHLSIHGRHSFSKCFSYPPPYWILTSNWNRAEEKMRAKDLKWLCQDFPGGVVVKNPPASAGDMGSSPGPWRSHMPRSNWARAPQLLSLRSRGHEPQLLSLRATATEACVPRACAPQKEKPSQWEACAPQKEKPWQWEAFPATKSSPRSTQLEKAHEQKRRPNTAKNK